MNLPKILLVDDTRLLLEIGRSFLANSPVTVLTASNGEECLKIMREERPDLVVLDQNMPKMTGITCCAAMRRDPVLKGVPVIMISSSSSQEDRKAFRDAGCNDFLAKPLDRSAFLGTVRRFLPGIDRRDHRVPCRIPVEISINGTAVAGVIGDLSLHGLYVATDKETDAGSLLSLGFRLPTSEENHLITANGRIAWVNNRQRPVNPAYPAGFGVELLEITGEGIAMLRKSKLSRFIDSLG